MLEWVWNLVFVDKPFVFELLICSSTCSKFWRGFRIDSIIALLISKSQVMTKFHKWLFQQRKLLARYFGIYLIFLQLWADHKKQGNCNKNVEYLYIFWRKIFPKIILRIGICIFPKYVGNIKAWCACTKYINIHIESI